MGNTECFYTVFRLGDDTILVDAENLCRPNYFPHKEN